MRNFCQDYVASQLGISQNAYSKYELGYSKITLETLFKIADIFGMNVADLIRTSSQELSACPNSRLPSI
ncbi:helix-turn-helix transcriptional regulator [Mucilaginibacter sp. PAMB04274]|uniref:helix-turn-helix domain-containing protein n=1 Tax=Mucilaginibacter sp. PAMB04274 TaxID=3138568 RepID=UPI0031F6180A